MTERVALLLTGDRLVRQALERLATDVGLRLVGTADGDAHDAGVEASVLVVDLDQPGALDEVTAWRARLPDAYIAGHLGLPRQDVWLQAEEAGCDLVANRGALAAQLRRRLPPEGRPRRRRVRLVETAEVPGRLGVVVRAPDTPVGPVALYHVRGELCAVADSCPHAGATVSAGELAGTVITCPAHGSRFDVCTGERLRGPADDGLRSYPVVEEDGFVHLLWG